MTYTAQDKYIFVSYSHKDAQKVLPLIRTLDQQGFRVWYDAGIEAGTEWPEYIEEHLMNASVVLVFMTPNTIESKNCRNEINFALELNKDVLVAYLQDTPLLKGMRLQLNSTQSLFRTHHSSDETFLRELINARLLQPCRKTAPAPQRPAPQQPAPAPQRTTLPRPAPTADPADTPSQIANVCSIGTNDENDLWPRGTYSQTINRDEHRVIFFHVNLLKPFAAAGNVTALYRIYDSDNRPVFEHAANLAVEAGYDRIAQGWIIRGTDGSFMPAGDYRFVCTVNNSPAFTYPFRITESRYPDHAPTSGSSFFDRLKNLF